MNDSPQTINIGLRKWKRNIGLRKWNSCTCISDYFNFNRVHDYFNILNFCFCVPKYKLTLMKPEPKTKNEIIYNCSFCTCILFKYVIFQMQLVSIPFAFAIKYNLFICLLSSWNILQSEKGYLYQITTNTNDLILCLWLCRSKSRYR